jgi:hypothetical protein
VKVHNVQQGDRTWRELRAGMPTASAFDQIVTPKTLKPAKGDGYLLSLLTEWALGVPLEGFSTGWTERGTELEDQGRLAYEWEVGGPVTEVGFLTSDCGRYGGSPDGLVGDDGLLEIKFLSAKVHVGYLLDPSLLETAYRCQCQGYLLITGRSWIDLCSCHAGDEPLPMVRVRCEPDSEWRAAFLPALDDFLARLDAGKARLRALGVGPQ